MIEPFRVAVAQLSPVFLNREGTIERACDAIREAGAAGARLIAFPEAFVPTYPLWVWSIPAGETQALRVLYAELLDQAITVPDASTARLCAAAREAGTCVAIGINERNAEASGTSLYNSLLYIEADGRVLGVHRKLVPTAGERLVHASGDGSTLGVYDTRLGGLGGLICWENYMPLARHALYAWGIRIFIAPTWDRGEPWLSTLRHIAKEGRVYVLGCCSAMRAEDVPDRYAFTRTMRIPEDGWLNPGDSAVVDPDGKFVAGPAHACQELLYAEVDPRKVTGSRFQLDAAGHYGRPDIFQLTVDRSRHAHILSDNPLEAPSGDGTKSGNTWPQRGAAST